MMKAPIQVAAKMPAHEAQPITVWLVLCLVPSKIRKKMKRADTEAYRTPKKIKVGIMKENATFFKVSFPREPKAGEVMYCLTILAKVSTEESERKPQRHVSRAV